MNMGDLTALSPFIMLSITAIVVMLAIALRRSHLLTVVLTLSGLALTLASISGAICTVPREVTSLIRIDYYALFFLGLIVIGTFAVAALSYSYFEGRTGEREEFYLLLLLATLGAMVLTAATHFASLFLGIELLERIALCLDRLPSPQPPEHRGRRQIPDPGRCLVRSTTLRHGARICRDRQHDLHPHRFPHRRSRNIRFAADSRARHGPGRSRVQACSRSFPSLDA